jgi:hypothetical protein
MLTFTMREWGWGEYLAPGKSQIAGYHAREPGVLVVLGGIRQ